MEAINIIFTMEFRIAQQHVVSHLVSANRILNLPPRSITKIANLHILLIHPRENENCFATTNCYSCQTFKWQVKRNIKDTTMDQLGSDFFIEKDKK